MLVLRLRKLGMVRGIYGPNKDLFPARAAFMYPEAAEAFHFMEKQEGPFSYSDILRGADESRKACMAGRGSQPPGYSGHNFGLSFDIDVERSMLERKWGYERLAKVLMTYGFHPYRQDLSRGAEDWHFNYLGPYAKHILRKTKERALWQTAAQEVINAYYPSFSPLSAHEIQAALKKLGLYSGEVDGNIGPLTKTSVNLFNQAWNIGIGLMNERFMRTLAFVAADKVVEG
jgi:hypothetical protein